MANISSDFKSAIKKWVELDNKHKKIKELNSSLKKEKDKYTSYIMDYMTDNNLTKKNVLISDGKISCVETKTTQTLSKKYLIEQLTIYLKNKDKAIEAANFVYDNREVKTKTNIKRFY